MNDVEAGHTVFSNDGYGNTEKTGLGELMKLPEEMPN